MVACRALGRAPVEPPLAHARQHHEDPGDERADLEENRRIGEEDVHDDSVARSSDDDVRRDADRAFGFPVLRRRARDPYRLLMQARMPGATLHSQRPQSKSTYLGEMT